MHETVSFKAVLELCGEALACRLAVAAVPLSTDIFAGIALGYIGEGLTRMEPFYTQFKNEQATTLIIGEFDVLRKKNVVLDTAKVNFKEALRQSRIKLLTYCADTEEGFWSIKSLKGITLTPLANDPGCTVALSGTLDERVWTHISAHLGVPVGLES